MQQPGLRYRSTNFAFLTSPHNDSYSCSEIPLIFYLIRKGSISLETKILSEFLGSMISMKQITLFVINTLAQLSSFLLFNSSVNICYYTYVWVFHHIWWIPLDSCVYVCVDVCVYLWLWIMNVCGKCEYLGEKKGYKIHMYIFYFLIHIFHTNTKN